MHALRLPPTLRRRQLLRREHQGSRTSPLGAQRGLGAEYTKRRRPVELVWQAEFENIGEAFAWEKRIQNWSRAKREALINGDYRALPVLSKKDFSKRRPSV